MLPLMMLMSTKAVIATLLLWCRVLYVLRKTRDAGRGCFCKKCALLRTPVCNRCGPQVLLEADHVTFQQKNGLGLLSYQEWCHENFCAL